MGRGMGRGFIPGRGGINRGGGRGGRGGRGGGYRPQDQSVKLSPEEDHGASANVVGAALDDKEESTEAHEENEAVPPPLDEPQNNGENASPSVVAAAPTSAPAADGIVSNDEPPKNVISGQVNSNTSND